MSDPPSWYDVLDVDPRPPPPTRSASAWRASIADLEPGSRRFDSLNRAAEVLLDPRGAGGVRRGARRDRRRSRRAPRRLSTKPADEAGSRGTAFGRPSTRRRRTSSPPGCWPCLGVVAAALVGGRRLDVAAGGRRAARRRPAPPRPRPSAPSYPCCPTTSRRSRPTRQARHGGPHGRLPRGVRQALRRHRGERAADRDPGRGRGGGVRDRAASGEERVDVLVFVDRPTTNKLSAEPATYKDQVTVTMQKVGRRLAGRRPGHLAGPGLTRRSRGTRPVTARPA